MYKVLVILNKVNFLSMVLCEIVVKEMEVKKMGFKITAISCGNFKAHLAFKKVYLELRK